MSSKQITTIFHDPKLDTCILKIDVSYICALHHFTSSQSVLAAKQDPHLRF